MVQKRSSFPPEASRSTLRNGVGAPEAKGRLTRVASVSAVDRASDELRRAIMRGTFEPGESIIIRELAADLGISPIPVREAMRRLEAEGFLTLRHAHSAVVKEMSRGDLDDIYHLRTLIEPGVVERSAKRFTEVDLDHLDELVAALQGADEGDEAFDLHQQLHLALLRPAASSWELRMLQMLWQANERYLRTIVPSVVAGDVDKHERHVRLVAIARARNGKKLKHEMERHLVAGRGVILAHLGAWTANRHAAATSDG